MGSFPGICIDRPLLREDYVGGRLKLIPRSPKPLPIGPILGFILRIVYGNPKKELLWGLWVDTQSLKVNTDHWLFECACVPYLSPN